MRRSEAKSQKRKQILMSVFIALIMVLSVFGVIIGTDSSNFKYGKYKFTLENGQYITKINGEEVNFYTLPYETQNLNLSNATLRVIKDSYFLLAIFDPVDANESLPAIELARFDMARYFANKPVQGAILRNATGYQSLPILSCANATIETPALIFNVSGTNSIVESGNCIYLNGMGNDFIKLRDYMIYRYHGVI